MEILETVHHGKNLIVMMDPLILFLQEMKSLRLYTVLMTIIKKIESGKLEHAHSHPILVVAMIMQDIYHLVHIGHLIALAFLKAF